MDPSLLIIGLAMPIAVIVIGAIVALWRRNNHNNRGSRENEDLVVRLVELLQGREESFTAMIRTQEITVETQRQIVAGQIRIQGSIQELVDIHLRAEGAMDGWQKLLDERVERLGDAAQRIENRLQK